MATLLRFLATLAIAIYASRIVGNDPEIGFQVFAVVRNIGQTVGI